jgi:hypothetical protein
MRTFLAVGCFAAGLLTTMPVQAAEEDDMLDPFRTCGEIVGETERLACFDRALASANAWAVERRDQRRLRTVDDFGFSATQLASRDDSSRSNAEGVTPAENPDQIASPIVEIFSDRGGGRVFLLENGQVWRQAGIATLTGFIRAEGVATVSRGGFGGGYRLRIEGRKGFVGVVRVR